jgi:MFS family permease
MSDTTDHTTISEVEANYRWNFTVNALDISFFTLAMNMISQATILPLLVSSLTDSKVAVGMIPAIFSLGFLLPQLLTAGHAEGLKRKKPFLMLWSAIGERLPYMFIGLAVLLLAKTQPTLTLVFIFLLLLSAAGTGGALTPAWYDMISKVIPVNRRGIWMGVGNGVGALMAIAGAALAGWFLTRLPYPQNYAACFLVATVFQIISWGFLALNREPESESVRQHTSLMAYFRRLPAVLRRDRNYQIFLVTRSVMNLGTMASGFFILFGSEHYQLSGAQVGGLTAMMVGSQALMNIVLGTVGDRHGHKVVLVITAFLLGTAQLVALLAPFAGALWVVFFLLGASIAGDGVAGFNIIVEFCAPEDRPTYVGLTNTLLAPARTLAPIFGGWLAATAGYPGLFLTAASCSIISGVLLAFWLREPRHKPIIELK